MENLLTNPIVVSTLIAGGTWLFNKLFGRYVDKKTARVAGAIATASALMMQLVLTERDRPVDEIIRACKGHIAIQLAKVGIYEADHAKYQPLIDLAISTAVTKWIAAHPDPFSIKPPATAKALGYAVGTILARGTYDLPVQK